MKIQKGKLLVALSLCIGLMFALCACGSTANDKEMVSTTAESSVQNAETEKAENPETDITQGTEAATQQNGTDTAETDGTAKILIEGYSSNAGNETKTNPKLSQQRAQSVADYFILNDIPAALIEVRHYSNTKIKDGIFDADKNCKASQCHRRVNISIKP